MKKHVRFFFFLTELKIFLIFSKNFLNFYVKNMVKLFNYLVKLLNYFLFKNFN
jgi:hypothetical protein